MLRPFPYGPGQRHQPGRNLGPPFSPVPNDATPLESPEVKPADGSPEISPVWFGRSPRRPSGPTPTPSPCPGMWPPLAPGASPPAVPCIELAAAYVPVQKYTTIWTPGNIRSPGTIFPELARVPPLYRWPPCTDGRS